MTSAMKAWLRRAGRIWTYGLVREGSPKRAFQQYMSPEVVAAAKRRGGEVRELTVLFLNLRGFTTLSQLEPAQVAEMLDAYVTAMTETVFKHGGIVDRFIGDGFIAVYNAHLESPDHALEAVQTALELQERTRDISRRWEARAGGALRCGVGISTGDAAFVGNIGSTQRMQYGAVGYTVDLAPRLESLTEEYNVPIVISETTHQHLAGRIPTRELGNVIPKDMTRPVKIFAMLT